MFTRVYLPQILTALFGGLFIFGGIVTFGDSVIFDRLFIAILIFAAVVCHNNINIVSVLLIIVTQRVIEELAWFSLQDAYSVKEILYFLTLFVIIYLRFDPLAKFAGGVLIVVILAELYWYYSEYPAPEIYWHVALINICLFSRYMIFSRLSVIEIFFPGQGQSTHLDWIIYKLLGISLLIQCASLIEYMLRHVLGLEKVLVIYYSYPYLMHGISIFAIWSTFDETYKQLLPRLLKA